MKIEIEIKRISDKYIYLTKGGDKITSFDSLEAAARYATKEIFIKCYHEMTDINVGQIGIHTRIELPGSEFQDHNESKHHYH